MLFFFMYFENTSSNMTIQSLIFYIDWILDIFNILDKYIFSILNV